MIVMIFEDFPDQVFPHLCCRDGSGQEHQLYEPPELCCDTWQEWLSAMASANPEYRHEILDKTKDFVSELELQKKSGKTSWIVLGQKNVGCGAYKEQTKKFFLGNFFK